MPKGKAVSYSADELAFIKARHDLPRAQLHAEFIARFGRSDVSENNLKRLCNRKGWNTGRTGQFAAGNVSHNKGKKGFCPPGSAKGWFRKGRLPHNTKGPGHESIDTKDGYVWLIVAETNPYTGAATRRVQKHRWLWEKANGPVPDGHRLKCLDGDKTNCDPSNWKAVPFALGPRLNGRYGRGYDAAPAELKPLILATAELEHAARTKRKGKKGHAG